MTGIALPGGGTLYGETGTDPNLVAPRTTWAAAGGAAPALAGINGGDVPTNNSTPFPAGTGGVADSSWGTSGTQAFFSLRILAGTGASGGSGYWCVTGLPVPPKMNTGQGRILGQGFLIDAEDNSHFYAVYLVADPFFSLTLPVLFYWPGDVSVVDPAGLNSAPTTGAVTTDTPEVIPTLTAAAPVYFSTGTGIAHDSVPFDFDDGCILNISGQYETT